MKVQIPDLDECTLAHMSIKRHWTQAEVRAVDWSD